MKKSVIRAAFVTSLPVLMGYSTMGMAFGILLADAGYGVWWALLMSVTMLSGSLQFAAVGIVTGPLTLLEVAAMSLLINIRYSVYGLSLIERFRNYGWLRFYLIFGLTDETYALVVKEGRLRGSDRRDFTFCVSFFNHLYWVAGGATGALLGGVLPFNTRGIDFAMTALFLVILTEQCLERRNRIPAAVGVLATLGALFAGACFAFEAERMLIPAMLVIIGALLALRGRLEPCPAAEAGEGTAA